MTAGHSDAEPSPAPVGPRLPLLRWGFLTVFLLAEAGALSAGYDAAPRGRDAGWAGTVVAWTPAVFRWALVAGGLAVVLGFWFLRPDLRAALRTPYSPAGFATALAGQLAAYGVFALCTSWVMGKEDALTPTELAAWLAAGLLTVATWAVAILPPRVWPRLIWGGRRLWLVAALIAALASLVARAARDEWDVLSEPTMRSAYGLLRVILPDVEYDPALRLLGTPRFPVEVGVPCSGYEGLGLMAVFLVVYLTLFRHGLRFPRAYLLVPLALAAVWVANVLRLVALVWIGDRVSPSVALGGFHSQAGWVGFNAVALGLLILAHRSRLFNRETTAGPAGPDATLAYLAPLLGAIVVTMLAAALRSYPAAFYPARVLVAGVLLSYFWRRYTVLQAPGRVSGPLSLLWAVTAGVGVFLLWVTLVPQTEADPHEALGEMPSWLLPVWVVVRVVGFVVVTPLAEELAFRGYLMRRLVSSDFEAVPPGQFGWVSLFVSSVLFGLMHGEIVEIVAGILAGLAYGLLVVRTGRVRDAVIAHAITNVLLMVVMAVTGSWAA